MGVDQVRLTPRFGSPLRIGFALARFNQAFQAGVDVIIPTAGAGFETFTGGIETFMGEADFGFLTLG